MTVKVNMASGLKSARKAAGKSVEEVGAVVSKSGKTISAWEVGRGQPNGDELVLICEFLGCHLADFYGDEYRELVTDAVTHDGLSDDERELVDCYRMLPDKGKRAVLAGLRDFAEQ